MTDAAFTPAELDEVLRGDGRGGFVGMSAIDGLIAALIAGPESVPQNEWLPLIFAGRPPSTIKRSSASRARATIMARYAEVEQAVTERPSTYRPMFMNHLGEVITSEWATGFMMGLSLRQNAWLPILTSPRRHDMAPILACSKLGRAMLPDMPVVKLDQIAATAPSLIADVIVAVRHFHEQRRHSRQTSTPRNSR